MEFCCGPEQSHLLWGVDDTGVVAELQGTQHRSSHSEHQAGRHLQKGEENHNEGLKLGSQLCPPFSLSETTPVLPPKELQEEE